MSVALCLSYNDISDFWCVVDQEGRMPPWPVGIMDITPCFLGLGISVPCPANTAHAQGS